jgi:NADH-quinone oxidoreductase subunit J
MTLLKIMAGYMKTFEQGELPPLTSTVEEIGTLLVTDHVLAFEISSILLLGALVGAAAIARPRKG